MGYVLVIEELSLEYICLSDSKPFVTQKISLKMKSKTTRVDIHHKVSKYLIKWRLLSSFKQFSLKKSFFFFCLFEVVQLLTVPLLFL